MPDSYHILMRMIYLDHAATTPCDPSVVEAMRPYFIHQFGNTLSPHASGRRARKATEDAREHVAFLIKARPQEIVFTSGATESNNTAIYAAAHALKDKGRHILVSAIEHHSILEPMKRLSREGFDITHVPVENDGRVAPAMVGSLIRPDTVLAAIGHANNEIGVVQDIEQIGKALKQRGICFLVDAVQSAGVLPIDVNAMHIDMLSLSAHKMYGPQGIGALYVRQGLSLEPLLLGGDQERSRRAGTLNVPGIAGFGEAARIAAGLMEKEAARVRVLREQLVKDVLHAVPGAVFNGHPQQRLPNNAHFSFEGIDGERLIANLDLAGICCSMGSACSSGRLEPSHVLKAIGLNDALALGSLRVTLGRLTTAAELEHFVTELKKAIPRSCSSRSSIS